MLTSLQPKNNLFNSVIAWCRNNAISILRISLAVIFLWFGLIKFFYSAGDAEDIAYETMDWLTGGSVSKTASLYILATIETLIGLGLLFNKWMPATLILLFLQLAGTLLPLAIFADKTWTGTFMVPTLLGHYIIKNAVLIAAGIVFIGTMPKAGAVTKKMSSMLTDENVAKNI